MIFFQLRMVNFFSNFAFINIDFNKEKLYYIFMDENTEIIDITKHIEHSVSDNAQKKDAKLHSNPIFKRLFTLHANKIKQKFSIKDLFR